MKSKLAQGIPVFPARAGMSRITCTGADTLIGVPRASGDEPVTGGDNLMLDKCSPRERG